MSREKETRATQVVGQDVLKEITNDDLVRDSAKIVEQVLAHYLPGEVEVTLLLAFPGQTRAVAVTTSVTEAERLRWTYGHATQSIPFLDLRTRGGKKERL